MQTLMVAVLAGVGFIVAYNTYGRWLGRRVFRLSASFVCPSKRLQDDVDYVPTSTPVVFGHHFTSIAGTGPIVGPAIAVIWGWLPALLWVLFGSIFIGAVHDFGSLVVSIRNNGQTVGDIAGRLLNPRVRILFLLILFLALTIVLAIFGLVIAAVFKKYPTTITPCLLQIPIAIVIGLMLKRRKIPLLIPSIATLLIMYLTIIYGNVGVLGSLNSWLQERSIMTWALGLLLYSYVASVLPVWTLLQPRDYINSLQLISAMGLVVIGLIVASCFGGAPIVGGSERPPLEWVAPIWDFQPSEAPLIVPFLFVTIACGAISGFHCVVSSGTSSKQIDSEPAARFVGYGGMLTEGFLATLVIISCAAGIGLGIQGADGEILAGADAWEERYPSWSSAVGLDAKVGAFVDGSANLLKSLGIPGSVAVALMGVLVASFAATTLDTSCRLQRYVVQELGVVVHRAIKMRSTDFEPAPGLFTSTKPTLSWMPTTWLTNRHGATLLAIATAAGLASLPAPTATAWTWETAGGGGLILWPLFGATNQLLGGLAFLVISFYLWRRSRPVWFLIPPLFFMLILPAWALLYQMFVEAPGQSTSWFADRNWILLGIGMGTLVLESWMVVEAIQLWPQVKGIVEMSPAPEPELAVSRQALVNT